MSAASILCVDDDDQVRRYISRILVASGHDCVSVGSTEEARTLLDERPFAVVLCDIGLPGRSGLDLVAELGRTHPEVATVDRDRPKRPDDRGDGLAARRLRLLTKPFEANQLLIDVTNALRRRKHEFEQRRPSRGSRRPSGADAQLKLAVGRLEAPSAAATGIRRDGRRGSSRAIESHDGETGAHVERVGCYASRSRCALDLGPRCAELLRLGARCTTSARSRSPTRS